MSSLYSRHVTSHLFAFGAFSGNIEGLQPVSRHGRMSCHCSTKEDDSSSAPESWSACSWSPCREELHPELQARAGLSEQPNGLHITAQYVLSHSKHHTNRKFISRRFGKFISRRFEATFHCPSCTEPRLLYCTLWVYQSINLECRLSGTMFSE